MGRTTSEFVTFIKNSITDPLLRQNTAERVRNLMLAFSKDYFNKQSDNLTINQVTGLADLLDKTSQPFQPIPADDVTQIPDIDLNTQDQYDDWVINYLRKIAGYITAPPKPTDVQVNDQGDTLSVAIVPGYLSISDYQGFSPTTGGTVILTGATGYIQNGRVYFTAVAGPVGIGEAGIGVAASGSRPAGPFAVNDKPFTGTLVPVTPTAKATSPYFGVVDDVNNIVTLGSNYAFTEVRWGVEGQGPQALASNSICSPGNITGRLFAYVIADPAANRLQSDTVFSAAFTQAATANSLPTATLSTAGGTTLIVAGQSVILNGAGQDTDGSVVKLEFLDNGVKLAGGEIAGSSGSLQTPALAAGSHSFTLRATDDKGAVGISMAVLVTVQPASSNATFLTQLGLTVAPGTRQASLYPVGSASDYSYSFTALPLPESFLTLPPAGAIKLSSISGVLGDAVITEGSTTYGTDATTAIQQFFDTQSATATVNNPLNVDWDIPVGLIRAIKLSSYTYIYARPSCGAILRKGANSSLFENKHFSYGAISDTNIGFYGAGIWNHNSFSGTVAPTNDDDFNQRHSGADIGWCCPFRFYGVANFLFNGGMVIRQRTFTFHLINTTNATMLNGVINAGSNGAPINTDGIHFNGNNIGLSIDNWRINSHDDKIAISVNDSLDRDVRGGNSSYYANFFNAQSVIENFSVTNVEFTGGVFGIRILSGANPVRNGTVKGLYGSTGGYWLIMDNFWQLPVFAGQGPGNVSGVTFEDIYINSSLSGEGYINECGANINCNAQNITFRNVNRNLYSQTAFPTILISGPQTVVNGLTCIGLQGHDLDSNNYQNSHILIRDAAVTGLTISNTKVSRLGSPTGNCLVELASGSLNNLVLTGVQVDGLANVVKHSGGSLGPVSATDVYHINPGSGNGSFYSMANPGPKVTTNNVTSQQQLQGTFTNG